ncbi:MAG: hypothetical protein ACFFAS_05995 [Promethearchaeota archaeon]
MLPRPLHLKVSYTISTSVSSRSPYGSDELGFHSSIKFKTRQYIIKGGEKE